VAHRVAIPLAGLATLTPLTSLAASPVAPSGKSAFAAAAAAAVTTSTTHPYDLVSTNGQVYNGGGAGWYGDLKHEHLSSRVAGIAVTPDGRGYWLAAQSGAVWRFGDARWYGSLSASHLIWRREIVSIRSTSDGRGYWLIGRNGSIRSFGDAPKIVRRADQMEFRVRPMVGAAVTPSGHGAWLVNARGDVYTVGEASDYGSLAHRAVTSPITAIASTPDGRGYWLTDARGGVFGYGDATRSGLSAATRAPVVGVANNGTASSFLAVTSAGKVVRSGATSSPTVVPAVRLAPGNAIAAITSARRPPPPSTRVESGGMGFDVSWPQCARPGSPKAGPLPALPRRSLAVVGVSGWAMHSYNPCLGSEVSWARRASSAYQLYMFINSPPSARDGDGTGPGGTCSRKSGSAWRRCVSYNYGYNAAQEAVGYARAHGVHSAMWWLDVENENGTCAPGMWSAESRGRWWSCDSWLNAVTLQAAITALRANHLTAGVYCTATQWRQITGGYVPSGHIPIWIAGAHWTSPPYPASFHYPGVRTNAAMCAGRYDFAGGHATMLQETPGSNYPYDPDYAC
jgi:hypothetical protein